jgi:hypothetical protein
MADRLYLSTWLRGFTAMNMLRHYEKALRLFPYSKLAKTQSTLRVYAVEYSEPALFEQIFAPPVDIDFVLEQARAFHNADCCYEFETAWDLWRCEPPDGAVDRECAAEDWKLAPSRVVIACFGPEFEHDGDEQMRIDFGLEATFVPGEGGAAGIPMVRANVQSLLRLVHDVDDRLPVERRRLWSESGENFAEKLQNALESLGSG